MCQRFSIMQRYRLIGPMLRSIWLLHIDGVSNSFAVAQSFFLLAAERMKTNVVGLEYVVNSDLCGIVLNTFLNDVLGHMTKLLFFQNKSETYLEDEFLIM